MELSLLGTRFIMRHEGLRLEAYPDAYYGWKVPTIGYGHTKTAKKGMVITEQEAEHLLAQDLSSFVQAVNDLITVCLEQHEFDALVSFVFNVGINNFKNSTLRRRINKGDKELHHPIGSEFERWRYSNSVESYGLITRRKHEYKLFRKADYRD